MSDIGLARSFAERCQAWHLVHGQYVKHGFVSPNASRLLFSPVDLLPGSVTAISRSESVLNGTLSAVVSPVGALPCGKRFMKDLERLGVEGRILCELTKLAANDAPDRSGERTSVWLTGYLLWIAAQRDIDDVFCVVHPKHAIAWSRLYGWIPVSDVKQVEHVNDNPGVLLHLDLARLREGSLPMSSLGQKIIDQLRAKVNAEATEHRLSGTEIALLLLQHPNVIRECPEYERSLLLRAYPWAAALVNECFGHFEQRWRPLHFKNSLKPGREREFPFSTLSVRARQEIQTGALSFLIISDNAYLSRYLPSMLGHRRHFASVSPTVSRARMLISEHVFDIVLLDERISAAETEEFADALRSSDRVRNCHTPIISLAVGDHSNAHRGIGKQWVFEHSPSAILLEALEIIASAPPAQDFRRFMSEVLAYTRRQPAPPTPVSRAA